MFARQQAKGALIFSLDVHNEVAMSLSCCHPHPLWLIQLTALLVWTLFLTGHLSEEERGLAFFYPYSSYSLYQRHSNLITVPVLPHSTPPQRLFEVTPIALEALWTKPPTLTLHTSPSLPLSVDQPEFEPEPASLTCSARRRTLPPPPPPRLFTKTTAMTTHQPRLMTLSAIAETVVRLHAAGHKVALISSGAIGVGLQRMAMPARPKSLSGKQATAIGQGRLIALWDNLFGQLGQPIAQVLLTHGDISDVHLPRSPLLPCYLLPRAPTH
ncbi:hypothetical protein EDB85DRAFT_2159479 [Lactarius pseudohatsudake]|nr:hypothetical protein EDB85DRAFT_2159479 [Lactarius pseudohatsudake]